MRPFDHIRLGDVYQNPVHGGQGLEWYVTDKSDKDKLIQVTPLGMTGYLSKPLWKKPSDRMFSLSWLVLEGLKE